MIGKVVRLVVAIIVIIPLFLFILFVGMGFVAGTANSSLASQPGASDAPITVTSSNSALANIASKLETTLSSPWCFGNLRGNLRLDQTDHGYRLSGEFSAPELLKKFSHSLPLPLAAVSHRCLGGSSLELQFVDKQANSIEIKASEVAAKKNFISSGPSIVFFGPGIPTEDYETHVESLGDFFGSKNGFLIHLSKNDHEVQVEIHGDREALSAVPLAEREKMVKDNAWLLSVHHFQSQPLAFSYVDSEFELIQPLNLTSRVEPHVRLAQSAEGRNVSVHGDETFDRNTLERIVARLSHSGNANTIVWLTRSPDAIDAWMVANPAMREQTEFTTSVMSTLASEIYSALLPEDTAVRLHACDRYLDSWWSVESNEFRGKVVIKDSNRIYYFEPFDQQEAKLVLSSLYDANLVDTQQPSELILFEDNGPVLQFAVNAELLTDENIEPLLVAAEFALKQVFSDQRSSFELVDVNRELIEDYEWVFNEVSEGAQEDSPVSEIEDRQAMVSSGHAEE